jgi:hypothetical protein
MDTSYWARFEIAKANKNTAYAEYNSASRALNLAQIKERHAEIRSQHEPIHSRISNAEEEFEKTKDAEKLVAEMKKIVFFACDYVVIGRKE